MSEIWGEWIEWGGGKRPVQDMERVMVLLRFGETSRGAASIYDWSHTLGPGDIVRYRRLLENEVREAAAKSPALNSKPSAEEPSDVWGKWNDWAGGKCPVSTEETVQVRFRNTEISVDLAGCWDWCSECDEANEAWEIVAYRRLLSSEVRGACAKSPALNTDRAQLMTLAEEASSIVNGDRRTDYGKPERNFERIAHLWTGYARAKGWNIEITASDVSPLMRLLKEARIIENPTHRDSHVDLIGYAQTGAEVNGVK